MNAGWGRDTETLRNCMCTVCIFTWCCSMFSVLTVCKKCMCNTTNIKIFSEYTRRTLITSLNRKQTTPTKKRRKKNTNTKLTSNNNISAQTHQLVRNKSKCEREKKKRKRIKKKKSKSRQTLKTHNRHRPQDECMKIERKRTQENAVLLNFKTYVFAFKLF